MYLVVVEKSLEILGSPIKQKETILIESLDNIEEKLSWYRLHNYKFVSLYKVSFSYEEALRVWKAMQPNLK